MSNIKLNCCKCGKEVGLTERIYTCGDLWQCEDCAIKQMQENDEKDQKITDLEAKLAVADDCADRYWKQLTIVEEENKKLKQQLAEKETEIKSLSDEISSLEQDLTHYKGEVFNLKDQLAESEESARAVIDANFRIIEERDKLKLQLAVKEKLLNQYPYKNDVIEEQYEDLKDTITFLMLNNIKDQEQLNYSIDVLCEKHKARIRDIENGICKIEQLEQQLVEKEKENNELVFIIEEMEQFAWEQLNNENFDKYKAYDEMFTKIRQLTRHSSYEKQHQDKISFCIEQLEKFRDIMEKLNENNSGYIIRFSSMRDREKFHEALDNQIKQLKGEK